MFRFLFLDPLLEGEPDGGASADPTPSDPSPPADAALPVEGDAASAEAEDDGTGAGADDVDEGDEGGDEGEPQEGDDDDIDLDTARALYRRFGAKFRETPEYQEEVRAQANRARDQAIAELSARPDDDPVYQQAVQVTRQTRAQINTLAKKLRDGEDVDVDELLQHAETYAAGARLTTQRTMVQETKAAIQQVLIDYGVTLPEESPVHDLWDDAEEVFERMSADKNPQTRAQAYRAFLFGASGDKRGGALVALSQALIDYGRQLERKDASQKQRDREVVRDNNKVTEIIARAGRRHSPPAPAQRRTNGRPALTRENLLAGDWRETQKLMQKAGHKI